MTPEEFPSFVELFAFLSVAMPTREADTEGLGQEVYFKALQYLPLAAVQASAQKIMRDGGDFFPSTARWCEVTDQIAYEMLSRQAQTQEHRLLKSPTQKISLNKIIMAKAQLVKELRGYAIDKPKSKFPFEWLADWFERQATKAPKPDACNRCRDSGFVSKMCEQNMPCAQHHGEPEFNDHEYVVVCMCVPTNPTIQRRREMAALKRRRIEKR